MKANFPLPATLDITERDSASESYHAFEVMEFRRDAMASGLVIDDFRVDGDFKAIDVEVTAAGAPIEAQLEQPDATTWIVRLPRPYRLQRIDVREFKIMHVTMVNEFVGEGFFDYLLTENHLSLGAAAVSDDKLHRLREMATSDYRAGRHWNISASQVDIYPVVGDKVMSESLASVANNSAIEGLILDAFAVRARDSDSRSGNSLLVAYHTISVFVHSQPQGLELAIAPVADGLPTLAEATGLNGFNLASNQDTVPLRQHDEAWSDGLQRYIDENVDGFGSDEAIRLALVFRSENPCRFDLDTTDNNYKLRFLDEAIFPPDETPDPGAPVEAELSFGGDRWQNAYYRMSLPANSRFHSAVLPFRHTLKKNAYSFVDSAPSEQALAAARAVELTTDQWAGGIFSLASAQSVRYLLLPLMAMRKESVCALEIREDVDGFPAGSVLTRQSLSLGKVGRREWLSVPLADALPLFSKKLWWLVRVTQGAVIQFVMESPQGAGISHFNLSESGGPGSIFRFTAAVSPTPFFARDDGHGQKLQAFIGEGDDWLALQGAAKMSGNLYQIDLLPRLPEQPQPSDSGLRLRLASLLQGKVTLYPPEIVYELAE